MIQPNMLRIHRLVQLVTKDAARVPGITTEEIMLALSGVIASALSEGSSPETRDARMEAYIRTIRNAVEAGPVQ